MEEQTRQERTEEQNLYFDLGCQKGQADMLRECREITRYDVYDGGEVEDKDGDYIKYSDIDQILILTNLENKKI